MKARRIELSLPIEAGTLPDPEDAVPVFHAWIGDQTLGEVLVDVARYGHVANAPAVILVGLVSDYACLLYTSDAADERSSVDLGGRRIIKKKKQ